MRRLRVGCEWSGDSKAITDDARSAYAQAYSSDSALTAGFDWYRRFSIDAEDNQHFDPSRAEIDTPALLLLSAGMAPLALAFDEGFRSAGLTAFSRAGVTGAGHFLPEEASERTWQLIAEFIGS